MEESETNPHIPNRTDRKSLSKPKPYKSFLSQLVKYSLIVSGVTLVLVGISLIFIIPRTTSDNKEAQKEIAYVLQPENELSQLVPVDSDLGFGLKYDDRQFTSYAKVDASADRKENEAVSGQYYENSDLRTKRDYNFVRITPKQGAIASRSLIAQQPQLVLSAAVTDADLKKAGKRAEYKDLPSMSLFIKLSSDERLKERTADDGTVREIESSSPSSRNINGVEYQKVRYTIKNENHIISNIRYDDCYYTIQYSQPYSVCINNIRPNKVMAQAQLEETLESVYFGPKAGQTADPNGTVKPETPQKLDDEKTDKTDEKPVSLNNTEIELAQSNEQTTSQPDAQKEQELIPFDHKYLTDTNSLKAIAKAQPSVVRVGALYCANISLKFENGQTGATLTDACAGRMSTGTIVSENGYIATTGHAVQPTTKDAIVDYINFAESRNEMFSRLDKVLNYLKDAKILFDSNIEYLKTGAGVGDQDALAKIESIVSKIPDDFISPDKEEYFYAIQPSNRPIVVNRSDVAKPSFAYSDAVLSATLAASNYEKEKSTQFEFDSEKSQKDAALLKVDGKGLQNLTPSSGSGVQTSNTLNILNYPAYSDGGMEVDNLRNAPNAMSPDVDQVYKQDNLIRVNTPLNPGSDGASVIDQQGKLVGMGTYGLSYCPSDSCFASGIIRPMDEIIALAEKSNITLGKESRATTTWAKAVDEYIRGNYSAAESLFKESANLYQFNAFATNMAKLSGEKKGSEGDTSLYNDLLSILIWVLIIMFVLTGLFTVAMILHKKRVNALMTGHYGQDDNGDTTSSGTTNVSDSATQDAALKSSPSENMPPKRPLGQAPKVNESKEPKNDESPSDPFYN